MIMLKRNAGGPLSVVLFSFLIIVRATAQGIPPGAASTETGFGGVNTISGMIVSSNGQRIEGRISVRLRTMTRGDSISTTDEHGNFVFRGVPSGDFMVVIDKEKDYEPFSQNVSVIQPRGMPPQNYYLSIRLIRKGATIAKGVINADLARVPAPALALYNKAIELAKNGDRLGAIKQLQAAIAAYADFMLAYNEMGVQYLRLNELEKADEALRSALKIDPAAYMPMMNRAIVIFTMKRYGEAAPLLRKVVEVKEDQAVGHYFLGQTMAFLGRFDEAVKELTVALKLGGDEMKDAHKFLGAIYLQQGDRERAVTEFETYLKLAPKAQDAEQIRQIVRQNKHS
jgi:Flp pilus assembly protein TadD